MDLIKNKTKTVITNKYFGAAYHAVALLHHFYAIKRTGEIDYRKSNDERVIEMERFTNYYFTSWNMAIQTIFLMLAVAVDLLHLVPNKFHKQHNALLTLKGYIFASLMLPCTLFVSAMFWCVYFINREWVLPEAADPIVPSLLNHSVHTFILIPIIMEILTSNHRLPKFKSAFIGLSILFIVYKFMFFYTYYQWGRWMYGLFYIFSWPERACFMVLNYLSVVGVMKFGLALQAFKAKSIACNYTKLN